MNRNAAPRPARKRRSEDITRRLAAARARNLDQIAAVQAAEKAERQRRDQALREQQKTIDAALEDYIDAAAAITAAGDAAAAEITALQAGIARTRTQLAETVARYQRGQALAAWRIKQAGRSAGDIAGLLGITPGKAGQLLAQARKAQQDDPEPAVQPAPAQPGNTSGAESAGAGRAAARPGRAAIPAGTGSAAPEDGAGPGTKAGPQPGKRGPSDGESSPAAAPPQP